METLIAFLLYLPLALLFAVAVLEFAGAWQHSNRYDASSALFLWLSVVAFLPALAIAWIAKPAAAAGIPNPFSNQGLTGIVVVLLIAALGIKAYCRSRGLAPKPRKHRRNAKLKGKALQEQIVSGSFRGVLAVTCVVAVLAVFQGGASIPPGVTSTPIADVDDEAKAEEPEPETIAKVDDDPKVEPEPEPVVAKVDTPEPPGGNEPVIVDMAPKSGDVKAVPAVEPVPKKTEPEPEPGSEPTVAAVKGDGTMEKPIEGSPFADVEPAMTNDPETAMNGDDPAMVSDAEPKTPEPPATTETTTPPPTTAFAQKSDIYEKIVAPLFSGRCNDCHGAEKQKGGLRLDSPEWIRKGGDSGPILVAGNPDKSYIYEVVTLPEDDPDIMPPKGKPLSDSQQRYIKQWILEGAPLNDGKQWPGGGGSVVAGGGNFAEDKMADNMATPNAALIQKLNDEGVIVRPLSSNGAMLEVDFSHAGRGSGDMRLGELAPLAANIHTLDLKKTKIVDDDLEVVEKMVNLRKINLALTDIGDNGMASIRGLENLEYLNLYGTRVSDSSVSDLSKMKKLTKLFLWNSRVTDSGYGKLKRALPKTDISFGL